MGEDVSQPAVELAGLVEVLESFAGGRVCLISHNRHLSASTGGDLHTLPVMPFLRGRRAERSTPSPPTDAESVAEQRDVRARVADQS
jgi:hypothetical protein